MTPSTTLAGPGARLLAKIIDGFILIIPGIFFISFVLTLNIPNGSQQLTPEMMAHIQASSIYAVPSLLIGMLLFIIIIVGQWILLARDGQTIGKKMMKVRIVKFDTGKNGGFVTNVLLRNWLNALITGIPMVGGIYGLVDICFIFRADRRCIHDLIAGTNVVVA